MKPRLVLVMSVTVLAFVSVACSSPESGTPTVGPSTSAAHPTNAEAPNVAHPLDGSAFVNAPCLGLTDNDVTELNLTGAHGQVSLEVGSPACTWQVASTGVSDSVVWIPPDTDGLSNVYARRATEAYFVTTSVDGYPAVYASEADLRNAGTCVLNVGINDHLFFFVDYELASATENAANAQQSCGAAEQTAVTVIRNLQSRQGS